MKRKISFETIRELVGAESPEFPKYATGLINLANQYAQGTRPKVVGQMSELIQEFPGRTYDEWKKWYSRRHSDAIEEATDKIWRMLRNLKEAMQGIDKEMVRHWAEDLVIVKTFVGLKFHEAILNEVAQVRGTDYRLATPQEESSGIDGYIGAGPVSIKPTTYESMRALPESIECEIIHYEKKKDGVEIEFQEEG